MTETIPTSEVLNRAADLIQERGWGHGSASMMGERGLCAMGAIFTALHGRDLTFAESIDDEVSYDLVSSCPAGRAMGVYLTTRPELLWSWNDRQESGERVIEALRACAVIEASREREVAEVSA